MICKELGWSLEFVEHGISFAKLQMMIADMPHYIKKGDKTVESIELTDDNAEDVYAMMMAHGARIKE